jgi:hypothetical protein
VAYGNTENPNNWTICDAEMNLTLLSGDGEKTVYMRFRDGLENTTNDITGNIMLDTLAPKVNPEHSSAFDHFVNSGSVIIIPLNVTEGR